MLERQGVRKKPGMPGEDGACQQVLHRRGRGRHCLLALAAALMLAAPCIVRAEPLLGPDEALTVDQVKPGMRGIGRSVFAGTKIESFHVTVLGVLKKIDFGGDMILIRIEDGPVVTQKTGVSAGMSGSPIYIDGKIIGALAFAWPFAREPVAGVTPIHQMLEAYQPGSAKAPPSSTGALQPVGKPLVIAGKPITRVNVVPTAGEATAAVPGTLVMTPVATPLFVSGMGGRALQYLQQKLSRYDLVTMPGPGRVDVPQPVKLEPGSAVGAQLVSGDVDMTAIGTVTYVKGDRVIAFGHPMFGLGAVDVPMTTAFIHGIISSQQVSFKLGSPIQMVGRVSQDRNWSIGGEVGPTPTLIPAEFAIRDVERGVSKDYKIRAVKHKQMTSMLIYSSLMNAIGSVAPPDAGTTRSTMEITAHGLPPVRRENTFSTGARSNGFEALFADPFAAFPMGELLEVLDTLENNKFGPVPVENIRVAVEVTQARDVAAIERVYADRKRVKPGEKVKVGVVIQPFNKPKETRELELTIPTNIPAGRVQIGVAGGQSASRSLGWLGVQKPQPKTLPQLLTNIVERERNSDLVIEMTLPVAGVAASGQELPNLPNSLLEVLLSANPSGVRPLRGHQRQVIPTQWTLSGGQILALQVETDERDKAGGTPMPSAVPGLSGIGSLFEELYRFSSGDGPGADDGLSDEDDGSLAAMARRLLAEREALALRRWASGVGQEVPAAEPVDSLPLSLNTQHSTLRRTAAFPEGPPKAPSWNELEELSQKDLEEIGIQDAAASGGGSAAPGKNVARAPAVWKQATQTEFAKGKTTNVLVTSAGELVLAPQAAKLHDSADRFLWGQAADSRGNVYVGTWLDGTVLKIDAQGTVTSFFKTDDTAVQSLCTDAQDNLYVGTLPSGRITRIAPDGTAKLLCRLEGESIWALQVDRAGNVYAATGSMGRLYRVTPDGTASVLFTAPDRHLTALATGPDEGIYVGTYPKGKVYHVTTDGKVRPVYEVPNAAVQSLAVDGKGNLYVGCTPRAVIMKVTPDGAAQVWYQGTDRHVMGLIAEADGTLYAAMGGGKLYRIAPDKTAAMLFNSETSYALSLSRDAHGSLYATTAGPSRVYRIPAAAAETGNYVSPVFNASNVARWGVVRWNGSPEAGTLKLQTRTGSTAFPDATWSDWSEAQTVPGQPSKSPVGQYAQYRALLAPGTQGPTTLRSVELFYLTRNRAPEVTVAAPVRDALWSGRKSVRWSAVDPDKDRLDAEVSYQREGTATWTRIDGDTKTTNLEAMLREGDNDGEAGEATPAAKAPAKNLAPPKSPSRKRSSARHKSGTAGLTRSGRRSASPHAAGPGAPPDPPAGLGATTPSAPADAAMAKLGGAEEADLEAASEDGDSTEVEWITRGLPDGRYRVMVHVSDGRSNPSEPLATEKLSDWFVVDNTPPTVRRNAIQRDAQHLPASIPCVDALSYLTGADYRVDGGEWIGAACEDGIWDSPSETAHLDAKKLPAGRHAIDFRIRDAAGNSRVEKLNYTLAAAKPAAPAATKAPAPSKLPVK